MTFDKSSNSEGSLMMIKSPSSPPLASIKVLFRKCRTRHSPFQVSDTVGDVSRSVVGGVGELVDAASEAVEDAAAAVTDGGANDVNAHLVMPGEDLDTLSVQCGEPAHAIIRANRLSSRKIKPGTRCAYYT